MADLNARIKPKKSSTAGEVPQAADLEVAEIAVNTADGKLFVKHTDDTIKEISGTGGGSGLPAVGNSGDVLAVSDGDWTPKPLTALLEGSVITADIHLDFDGPGDIPVMNASGMSSTFPSLDPKWGTGGASFTRASQDFLQGSWPTGAVGTQVWTLSFWVKTTDTDYSSNTGKRIIAPVSGTNLANGFQILREPKGGTTYTPHGDNAQGAFVMTPGGNTASYLVSTRTLDLADGDWHFLVFQHEGGGVYSCFVDGSLTERRTAAAPVNFGQNGGFFIGKRQDNNVDCYFDGSLDNFVLEIGSIMSSSSTVAVPDGPVGLAEDNGPGIGIGSLADVDTETTAPTDGQSLVWVDANSRWEPVSRSHIGDLEDVSYDAGSLEPVGLDQIVFSSADVASGETWKVFANTTYGMGMAAYSGTGSYFYIHADKGILARMDRGAPFYITGESANSDNTPEIRLTSGDPFANSPTGNYFGLTLPDGYSVDQTYSVPEADGTAGQVLSTDGTGNLFWQSAAGGAGGGPAVSFIKASIEQLLSVTATTVTFPAEAEVGDLMLIMVLVRDNGTVPTPLRNIPAPAGWTRNEYEEYASATDGASFTYALLSRELDAADIASGSVTITPDSASASTNIYTGWQVYRDAVILSTDTVDTTIDGNSLPTSGYDFVGQPRAHSGAAANFVSRIFSSTDDGYELTREADSYASFVDGYPNYGNAFSKLVTCIYDPGVLNEFNIKRVTSDGTPGTLSNGFSIGTFNLGPKPSEYERVIGGTFGSGV